MSEKISAQTLPQAFLWRVQRTPEMAMFATKRRGSWEDLSYREAFQFIRKTMAGLQRLGFSEGDKIVIFSENREEWTLTDYAAQSLRGATSAIYTTSAKDEVEHILKESEASVLFISGDSMLSSLRDIKSIETLKYVVSWDRLSNPSRIEHLGEYVERDQFLKEEMTEEEAKNRIEAVQPKDLAILLYTSGTTARPKGVMLTQKCIMVNLKAMHEAIPLEEGSRTVSFLPLSHIYERSLQSLMILSGLRIAFAESLEKLVPNIGEIKPHIMIGVPRVFEKMYDRIMDKISNSSWLKKRISSLAFWVGRQIVPYRQKSQSVPLAWDVLNRIGDKLVLEKIRAVTGGQLRFFVSGGAPLSKDIGEFFFASGIKILEGYGLSETIILSVNRPNWVKFGTVGIPFKGVEMRIADDGEIQAKGEQIMKGYYKQPEATRKAFTKDGWFKTGDIGEFDQDGFLAITDRKKEIIVTAGGKNVAPQPIENRLKKDPLVESVCVIGDQRKYLAVLIVPSLENCQSWARKKGKTLSSLSECAKDQDIRQHYQKLLDSVNKNLPRYSTLKAFDLLEEPFSIDGEELTPTLKLKRRVIYKKYADQIDLLYGSNEKAS